MVYLPTCIYLKNQPNIGKPGQKPQDSRDSIFDWLCQDLFPKLSNNLEQGLPPYLAILAMSLYSHFYLHSRSIAWIAKLSITKANAQKSCITHGQITIWYSETWAFWGSFHNSVTKPSYLGWWTGGLVTVIYVICICPKYVWGKTQRYSEPSLWFTNPWNQISTSGHSSVIFAWGIVAYCLIAEKHQP